MEKSFISNSIETRFKIINTYAVICVDLCVCGYVRTYIILDVVPCVFLLEEK